MTDQPTPRMRMTYTEALDAASLQLGQAANGGWHAQDADHYATVGAALVSYAREIREDAAYRASLDAEATAQDRREQSKFRDVIEQARRDYRPGVPDDVVPAFVALTNPTGGSTVPVVAGSTAPRECNQCGLPAVWRDDLALPQWQHVDHGMSVEAAGRSHSPSFD